MRQRPRRRAWLQDKEEEQKVTSKQINFSQKELKIVLAGDITIMQKSAASQFRFSRSFTIYKPDSSSIKYGRRHRRRRPLSEEKDEVRWAWPFATKKTNQVAM